MKTTIVAGDDEYERGHGHSEEETVLISRLDNNRQTNDKVRFQRNNIT